MPGCPVFDGRDQAHRRWKGATLRAIRNASRRRTALHRRAPNVGQLVRGTSDNLSEVRRTSCPTFTRSTPSSIYLPSVSRSTTDATAADSRAAGTQPDTPTAADRFIAWWRAEYPKHNGGARSSVDRTI